MHTDCPVFLFVSLHLCISAPLRLCVEKVIMRRTWYHVQKELFAMSSPNPTTIVIFGASGDLTHRKLIPALYQLCRKERLPASTRIVGFARRPYSHADFRENMREAAIEFTNTSFDAELWERFSAAIWYVQGDLNTAEDFQNLEHFLRDSEQTPTNRLYYLATAPEFYETIIDNLDAAGMVREQPAKRRIVIEKPFGRDLATAQALNQKVHAVFDEHQVYRIDHYLGKETAQNIMFFRFGNTVFENVWNRNYIDHVQISVVESNDVGHRAGYYDKSGVLRDMFQNHLLQLLALVAMEPPASFRADAVRNETTKVLEAVRPFTKTSIQRQTLRAQYRGYCEAPRVAPNSTTPTYAAMRLNIDNWRWQGVPFYLRSGKALTTRVSEVNIQFHRPPHLMFPIPQDKRITPDMLSVRIQPDEGIYFSFQAKVPDTVTEMGTVGMSFNYADSFGECSIPEAYERLLLDALMGDATLFIRSDAIEQSWQIIDPILKMWESPDCDLPVYRYEPGTWGPTEADTFIERDNRQWLWSCGGIPCK
jgi:glucose-6-phosphate 1-dehydrogenase